MKANKKTSSSKKTKNIKGTVVKIAGQNVVVEVIRQKTHRLYGKQYMVSKKFHVKTTNNNLQIGDVVSIKQTRPKSAIIRWQIIT